MTDTSDPKEVKEALKAAKSADAITREGLRQTMQTEQGRKRLHSSLLKCDPYNNPFSRDAPTMAFRCGEMNIGLQLVAEMHEVSPELYLQMMKENK